MKLDIVQDGLATKFFPSEEQKEVLMDFGRTFGLRFLENQAAE